MIPDLDAIERAYHALRRALRTAQRCRDQVSNMLRRDRAEGSMTEAELAGAEKELRLLDRVIDCTTYALSHLPSDPDERLAAMGDALSAVETLAADE